jgi:hypothetical protein
MLNKLLSDALKDLGSEVALMPDLHVDSSKMKKVRDDLIAIVEMLEED